MSPGARRVSALIIGIVLLYAAVVVLLLRVLPPNPTAADLMVAGSMATLATLLLVFGFLYFTQTRKRPGRKV
jgi:hypothetical protein